MSTQATLQFVLGLVADTAFVLASKPPHTAKPSEIEKDNQPLIDRSISSVHLVSSVLIYGLAATQAGFEWNATGRPLVGHAWSGREWIGVGAMIFGGSLRLWCYRTLGQFFTFNLAIRENHKLVTSGPYSLVRHPSYTGLIAMVVGLSLRYTTSTSFLLPYIGQWPLRLSLLYACTGPTLFIIRRIKQEEAMLEKEFGVEWKAYRQKTWKLLPYIW